MNSLKCALYIVSQSVLHLVIISGSLSMDLRLAAWDPFRQQLQWLTNWNACASIHNFYRYVNPLPSAPIAASHPSMLTSYTPNICFLPHIEKYITIISFFSISRQTIRISLSAFWCSSFIPRAHKIDMDSCANLTECLSVCSVLCGNISRHLQQGRMRPSFKEPTYTYVIRNLEPGAG